jgi:hypothetical protein
MILTISNQVIHFFGILILIIVIIITLTLYLYNYTTDIDFAGLPPKDKSKLFDERFVSLLYYNASVNGGLGDSAIYPTSNKGKIYTSIYLIIIAAGIFTAIDF